MSLNQARGTPGLLLLIFASALLLTAVSAWGLRREGHEAVSATAIVDVGDSTKLH